MWCVCDMQVRKRMFILQVTLRSLKYDERKFPRDALDTIWRYFQSPRVPLPLLGSRVSHYSSDVFGFELSIDHHAYEYLRFLRGIYPRDITKLLGNAIGSAEEASIIQKKLWTDDSVSLICENSNFYQNLAYGDNLFSPTRLTDSFISPLYFLCTYNRSAPTVVTDTLKVYDKDVAKKKIIHLTHIAGVIKDYDMFFGDGAVDCYLNILCRKEKYDICVIDIDKTERKSDGLNMEVYLIERNFRTLFHHGKKIWMIYANTNSEQLNKIVSECCRDSLRKEKSKKSKKSKKRKFDRLSKSNLDEQLVDKSNDLKKLCIECGKQLNNCITKLSEVNELLEIIDSRYNKHLLQPPTIPKESKHISSPLTSSNDDNVCDEEYLSCLKCLASQNSAC